MIISTVERELMDNDITMTVTFDTAADSLPKSRFKMFRSRSRSRDPWIRSGIVEELKCFIFLKLSTAKTPIRIPDPSNVETIRGALTLRLECFFDCFLLTLAGCASLFDYYLVLLQLVWLDIRHVCPEICQYVR